MASSKVAVVTGANQGIGLGIVRILCKGFKGDVFLTARDEKRGLEAVELLKKEGLSPKFHTLDIDSKDSIAKFRDFIKTNYGGLDVLVNNAGMAYKGNATEPFSEQAEVTNRVNYFGLLNICNELFPLLRKNARVVNVSSCEGFLLTKVSDQGLKDKLANPKLTVAELTDLVNGFIAATKENNHTSLGWPNSAYAVSKVAVSALSRIQQREINESRPNDDILVNHVHPGYVNTSMTSHKGQLSIEQGAAAPSWLALLPPNDPKNPKGDYVWHCKTVVDWVNGPAPSAY